MDITTETEWVAIVDRFENDATRLIRGMAPADRVQVIDDLEATVRRIHGDLMAREIQMLTAQGYTTPKIAQALGITIDRVRRIIARKDIEKPIPPSERTPEGAIDVRADFIRLRDSGGVPQGYSAAG